ncbi:YchJ family protein [Thiomicrorhabdus xiamenensis]|uniref:SEC-C domain-containing protein n=1 Tax=Thiomicrorhabdus xiamenensis TaxID=2739063 RepID=A0A7D4TE49_9GAMM|nr:YchJ family metal-binding protein [Thiomicrorhabdus xiamenensis]QKI89147.1 SEC-C domain-containing protein [Thiomicrorhabdus xiamenensis]
MNQELCPCGSGKTYPECCGAFHSAQAKPETAEALMRSRYSAFVKRDERYLLTTWDESTRPEKVDFEQGLQWTLLKINGRKKGRKRDQEGWVTFVAHYRLQTDNPLLNPQPPQEGDLHETSYFRRDPSGHWVYVDGEIK